ncbi:MAG: hypothetical protein ACOCV9_01155, partial [Marinilabiliaceae bacterium]
MKNLLLFAFLLTVTGTFAQKNEKPDWENPLVTEINKEPGRAAFRTYDNLERVLKDEAPEFRKSLNGTWKFH